MQFLWTMERVVFYGSLRSLKTEARERHYHTTPDPEEILIIQFVDIGILIFELKDHCNCDCVRFWFGLDSQRSCT